MADEVSQKDLFAQLQKNDVAVPTQAAEQMKENIMNAGTGQKWLGLGVHEVEVTSVDLTQAKSGTMGIRFTVENGEGKNEVTMWLSEKALPYTIENVSRIVVHNAPADGKDKAREFMADIVSAKELYETIQAFVKESKAPFTCFLSIREAKDGSTYTDKNGVERPQTDKNLLSYEPKETATQAVVKEAGGEVVSDISNLPF